MTLVRRLFTAALLLGLLAACSDEGNDIPSATEVPDPSTPLATSEPLPADTPAVASATATAQLGPTTTSTPPPGPLQDDMLQIIDMHFHPDASWDLEALVQLMDELGVRQAIGGSGDSGVDALQFAEAYPDRFVPFAGQDGLRALNLIQGATSWDLQSDEILAYVDSLETQLQAGCWAGIGEIFVNTESSHVSGGFSIPTDTPLMRRLLDLSAEFGTPLSVHMDAAPASVEGLRSLLASNPEGTLIWAHAGWYAEPDLLRDLLASHPNLYIETSFRDELRSFFPVSADGVLNAKWHALIEEMPDRFVLGTDLNPPPTAQKYSELVGFWRGVIQQLSPETAAMVARQNAERLIDDAAPLDAEACISMLGD
jgi:hypothetical protein